jgi:hypothetical protein
MPKECMLIFKPKISYHVPSKSIRATPWIALEVAKRCKNNDSTCPDTTSDYKRISHVNRLLEISLCSIIIIYHIEWPN